MSTKEMATRQEILQKAHELSELIAQSHEVEFFKRAEQKIKNHEKVNTLIAQIKRKQKEAVNLEHHNVSNALNKVEEEIDQLHAELDEIPLVREFKQSQMEVNDLLQMITNTISNSVTEKIILSTGGDPLYGKTGDKLD